MEAIQNWFLSNRPYYEGVALYQQYGKDPLLQLLFLEGYSEFKREALAEALQFVLAPCCDSCEHGHVCDSDLPISDDPTPFDHTFEVVIPGTEHLENRNQFLEERNDELHGEYVDLLDQVEELEDENNELRDENDQLSDENKQLKKKAVSTPKGWPAEMDAAIQGLYDQWLPMFKERKDLQARILDVALAGEADPEKEEEAGAMAHQIVALRKECQKIYRTRDYYLEHKKLPEEAPLPNLVTDPKKHPKSLANHQRYLRDYKAKFAKATTDEERQRLAKNIALQQQYVDHYKKLLA